MSKPKDDLISRAAALEAIDGIKPIYKEQLAMKALCWAAVKTIQPVDVIPVEWLEWRVINAKYNGIKEAADAFDFVLKCWKEQEAR